MKKIFSVEFYKYTHSRLFLGLALSAMVMSMMLYLTSLVVSSGSVGYFSIAATNLSWFTELFFPLAIVFVFSRLFSFEANRKTFRNALTSGTSRIQVLDGKILFGIMTITMCLALVILMPVLMGGLTKTLFLEETSVSTREMFIRTGASYLYALFYLVAYAFFCVMVSLTVNNHKVAVILLLFAHFLFMYMTQLPFVGAFIRGFTFWWGGRYFGTFSLPDLPVLDIIRNIVVFTINIVVFYLISMQLIKHKDY